MSSRGPRLVCLAPVALVALTVALSVALTARGAPTSISYTSLAAGEGFTCALTSTGGVMCWGENKFAQLGDGTKGNRYRPTRVVGLSSGVKQIAVGARHACALMSTGAVKCWGNSTSGQVGNGKVRSGLGGIIVTPSPDDVVGLSGGVKAISAGDYHTCALMNTGTVKCWGREQGIQGARDTGIPVESGLGGGIIAISAALLSYDGANGNGGFDEHTCAITTAGAVECWSQHGSPPVRLPGFSNGVKAISTAHSFCVLTTSGAVRCASGIVPTATVSDEAGLESGVTGLSAFGPMNCALTSAGAVKCWGAFFSGATAPAGSSYGATPVGIPGLGGGVKAIAVGVGHACAIMTAGGIKCWGEDYFGQLGTGQRTRVPPFIANPVDVVGPKTSAKTTGGTTGGSSTGAQGASVAGPSMCSPATAKQVAKPLLPSWVDPVFHTVPIAGVLCGHFVGRGSNAMVASLAAPAGCGGIIGWAVLNHSAGRWRVVMKSNNGAFLSAVGSDIRATQGNPKPGDPFCSPSAWKSQLWHWNGKRFMASPWAPSPPPKIHP